MSGERNTEIWSTRIQRELLALTTENAPEGTKDEIKLVLPPFVTVKEHKLDIEHGTCAVMFQIELPVPVVKKEKPAEETQKEEGEKPAEGESESDAKETEAKKEDEDNIPTSMVITLDASLNKKPDGSVDPIAVAYPFLKPAAILTSGAKAFPKGSTIKDGDFIDIEMDWTPSLHLTDAILNISLKIKESILQGEPFYPAVTFLGGNNNDSVDEMVNKAKRFGASFTQGLRGMAHIGSDKSPQEKKEKKGLRIPGMKKKEEKKKKKVPKANPGEIRIGDEINMLEAPWVDCQGVYSCKAIRRPAFVDAAMAVATQNEEQPEPQQQQQQQQVRSFFEEGDDGEIPEDIGNYMKLQAGSIGQVCALLRASEVTG